MRRILVVCAVLAALYLTWYHQIHGPLRPAGAPPLVVRVVPGASVDEIGRQLRETGVGRHPLVFRTYVALRGAAGRLRAGEYSLEGPLSLDQIVDLLVRGETVRHDVTFPEGKTIEEMAAIVAVQGRSVPGLSAEAFLKAARDPASIRDLDPKAEDLEGYLFPDTYDLPRGPDPAGTLVARMVQRFRAVIAPERVRLAEQTMTLREVMSLAAIVELESARAEERPRIAAVFLNRLKKGIPLQADPTVIYALRKAGPYDGNVRKKDLDLDSPYNTYRYRGLPPGPIAAPGRGALQAVLYPAPVKDLYFVSRNDGSHEFSETLAQHERAVDRYQRRRGSPRADPGP